MKAKNHYLCLAVVFGILCVPAFGEKQCFSPAYMPALPDLSTSDGIVIMISPCASNTDGLVWGELHEKAHRKITEATIKMHSKPIRGNIMHIIGRASILRIDVDLLKLDDSQQYVLRTQTSLAVEVSLADEPERYMKADIWWSEPVMQIVPVNEMPAKVTGAVLHQVDEFIKSYFASNPPDANVGEVNVAPIINPTKQQTEKSHPIEYKFVGSKNSDIFHKADCQFVSRISAQNLVSYDSREEAVAAGKKPCSRCKP
jgi:hypothetical protein